jgi:hypothetical protein
MTSEFLTYLRLGLTHIADLQGYDHILFIVALTAGFALRDWSRLLWLVTAFTLGHSVTLVLATLDLVRVRASLIELLIAVTIVLTGLYGFISHRGGAPPPESAQGRRHILYAMAGGFGLIHGLGFSSFLRTVLGTEDSLLLPLFAFNVGLEVGQLAIVGFVLLAGAVACDGFGLARRRWAMGLALLAVGLGSKMVLDRLS